MLVRQVTTADDGYKSRSTRRYKIRRRLQKYNRYLFKSVWCGLTRCHRLPLSLARRSSCRSPRAGPPRRSRGVASSILHKWEGFGWCSGVITKANDDLRRSIGGDKVNLFAHYEIDGEDENDVPHVLYTCSSSTSTGRRTTPSTTRGAARVTRRRGAGR